MIWPRPHTRSAAEPEACRYLALQSQVGLAFDSEALTVVCEQSSYTHLALRGPLPSFGSVVRSLDDWPFGIMDLASCAHRSPAGPWCVCHGAQERGGEGRAVCQDRRPMVDGQAAEGETPPQPPGKSFRSPAQSLSRFPLPLKTIWRIITFIMSFIMGDSSSCLKINAGLRNYIWYMEAVCM